MNFLNVNLDFYIEYELITVNCSFNQTNITDWCNLRMNIDALHV